jgi:hypothetical protein
MPLNDNIGSEQNTEAKPLNKYDMISKMSLKFRSKSNHPTSNLLTSPEPGITSSSITNTTLTGPSILTSKQKKGKLMNSRKDFAVSFKLNDNLSRSSSEASLNSLTKKNPASIQQKNNYKTAINKSHGNNKYSSDISLSTSPIEESNLTKIYNDILNSKNLNYKKSNSLIKPDYYYQNHKTKYNSFNLWRGTSSSPQNTSSPSQRSSLSPSATRTTSPSPMHSPMPTPTNTSPVVTVASPKFFNLTSKSSNSNNNNSDSKENLLKKRHSLSSVKFTMENNLINNKSQQSQQNSKNFLNINNEKIDKKMKTGSMQTVQFDGKKKIQF